MMPWGEAYVRALGGAVFPPPVKDGDWAWRPFRDGRLILHGQAVNSPSLGVEGEFLGVTWERAAAERIGADPDDYHRITVRHRDGNGRVHIESYYAWQFGITGVLCRHVPDCDTLEVWSEDCE